MKPFIFQTSFNFDFWILLEEYSIGSVTSWNGKTVILGSHYWAPSPSVVSSLLFRTVHHTHRPNKQLNQQHWFPDFFHFSPVSLCFFSKLITIKCLCSCSLFSEVVHELFNPALQRWKVKKFAQFELYSNPGFAQ